MPAVIMDFPSYLCLERPPGAISGILVWVGAMFKSVDGDTR